ncbi:MAG: recombinase [Bacteroidota bacterium]
MEMTIDKIGGIGASEIGKLFTKDGLKAKTAQTLAYEKAEELINGYKKELTTVAMQHGIFNEEEAFSLIIRPNFPNARYQSDESILIKDNVWVTPDVVDDIEGITTDIKCPYTIFTYYKNIRKLPDTYIAQNQMQMMGTGHENGFVLVYLTSNSIDKWGNKIEYDIPLEERHMFLPLTSDEVFQKEIMQRVDGFFPLRDMIYKDLVEAHPISDEEYFEAARTAKRVTRFKDKSNLLTWGGKIFSNQREGFIVIEN